MRFLKATTARRADFSCSEWSLAPANVTREQVARARFVHDVYAADFTGDFDRAVAALVRLRDFRAASDDCPRLHA